MADKEVEEAETQAMLRQDHDGGAGVVEYGKTQSNGGKDDDTQNDDNKMDDDKDGGDKTTTTPSLTAELFFS